MLSEQSPQCRPLYLTSLVPRTFWGITSLPNLIASCWEKMVLPELVSFPDFVLERGEFFLVVDEDV